MTATVLALPQRSRTTDTTAAPAPWPGGAAGAPMADVETIYGCYAQRCRSLARRLTGDDHLAEDVVQEVFLDLHRRADRFDPARGNLAAWLTVMTRNKSIDLIRWQQRRTSRDTDVELARTVTESADGPDVTACRTELSSTVRDAVLDLGHGDREVIWLAYYEGLSQAEIALRLGIPLGTVKTRTRHALLSMRGQLVALSPENTPPRQSA